MLMRFELILWLIDTLLLTMVEQVVLETEYTNQGALNLYQRLGFIRDKRLYRYYLNGIDAFRLKLFCKTMVHD